MSCQTVSFITQLLFLRSKTNLSVCVACEGKSGIGS